MKSLFPGMDPYLEDLAYWEGFHFMFISQMALQLSKRLPKPYVADATERVHRISIADEAAAQYVPDVAVALKRTGSNRGRTAATARPDGGVATLEPVTFPVLDEIEVREHSIEIRKLPGRELVTSIELLSPANKFGEGIGEYRAKRRAMTASEVHVVELDLLRRGARADLGRPLPAGDYYAFVFFGDQRREVDVYAWPIRRALPTLPIPLRAPDGDVALDLATVFDKLYDEYNYVDKLDYDQPVPPPSLSAADAQWAADLIAASRS